MRLSVLNDRTSPILPDGSQANRLSGFNDLGEEFTILRKVRTDTIMIAASYPSRLPMWDQKRKAAIGPACLAGIVRAFTTPATEHGGACRIAATNIKFSGRSGCSLTSTARTFSAFGSCEQATVQHKAQGAPPSMGFAARIAGQPKCPFTTCVAGPAWQKPRPAHPQNGEARRPV